MTAAHIAALTFLAAALLALAWALTREARMTAAPDAISTDD